MNRETIRTNKSLVRVLDSRYKKIKRTSLFFSIHLENKTKNKVSTTATKTRI